MALRARKGFRNVRETGPWPEHCIMFLDKTLTVPLSIQMYISGVKIKATCELNLTDNRGKVSEVDR